MTYDTSLDPISPDFNIEHFREKCDDLREDLDALCDGCKIQRCLIEGNTLTPCTCGPEPINVVDLIQWHAEDDEGLPVSNHVVTRLRRAYPHHVPGDVAVSMLRTRLSHSRPEAFTADNEPLGEDVTTHCMSGEAVHYDGRTCRYHVRLGAWAFADDMTNGRWTTRCLRTDHPDVNSLFRRTTKEDA